MNSTTRRTVITVVVAALTLFGLERLAADAGSDRAGASTVEHVASGRKLPGHLPQSTMATTVKVAAPTTTNAAPTPTTAAPAPTTPPAPKATTPRPATTPAPRPAPRPAPVTSTPATRPPTPVVAAPVAVVSSGLSSAAQADMLARVNAVRGTGTTCGGAAYGPVAPLTLQTDLILSAAVHAVDMATHNYFSHTGLDGSDPGARITAAGYRWQAWAENIAAGQPDAASVVAAWFASPDHCENFMSPTVSQIGFALAVNPASTYGTYWVADLGHP